MEENFTVVFPLENSKLYTTEEERERSKSIQSGDIHAQRRLCVCGEWMIPRAIIISKLGFCDPGFRALTGIIYS